MITQTFRDLAAMVQVVILVMGSLIPSEADARVPVISESISPTEVTKPLAKDGHLGFALVRSPPGDGPFPGVVLVHGGLTTWSGEVLRDYVNRGALPSKFLAAGYVVATMTYRSRNHDLQSQQPRDDVIAAVEHLAGLPQVDSDSIGIFGCSGGGDLALAAAAEIELAAVIAEEPASIMFTGVWDNSWPKTGEFYTAMDSQPVFLNPDQHYSEKQRQRTKRKINRISAPIMIVQGDVESPLDVNGFNETILVPQLRAAGKELTVSTYESLPHCGAFLASFREGNQVTEEAAEKAFVGAEAFLRSHVSVIPVMISEPYK